MTVSGVYSITNNVNKKIYIGQSMNVKQRWNDHLNELKGNRHKNKHLNRAFNKYGESNFSFKLIKVCKPRYLDRFEKLYIKIYDAMNPQKGYNKINGGNQNKVFSDEMKRNISKGLKQYYKEHPLELERIRTQTKGMTFEKSLDEIINHSKKYNTLGLFRVNKHYEKSINLKKGYRWRYVVQGKNPVEIQSTNLYDLKLKVLDKQLPWIEFTRKAEALVESDKKTYNPYSNYPSSTGYYRVTKVYNKKYKQGFIWEYHYFVDKKHKKMSSIDLERLEQKVKAKGLEWYKIGGVE